MRVMLAVIIAAFSVMFALSMVGCVDDEGVEARVNMDEVGREEAFSEAAKLYEEAGFANIDP